MLPTGDSIYSNMLALETYFGRAHSNFENRKRVVETSPLFRSITFFLGKSICLPGINV